MTVEHHVAQSLTVPMFAYRDSGGSGEQAAEACALRLLRVASDGAALRSGSKLSSTASDMLWTVMVARSGSMDTAPECNPKMEDVRMLERWMVLAST
jgi:hypothetical protein